MTYISFSQDTAIDDINIDDDTILQTKFKPKLQKFPTDSLGKDSTFVEARTIKIAENDLDDNVFYKATDSIIYDIPNKSVEVSNRKVHVSPPFVVLIILPFEPTAIPLLMSVNDIEFNVAIVPLV